MSNYYGLIEMLVVFGIVMVLATWGMVSAIRDAKAGRERSDEVSEGERGDEDEP